MKIDIRDIKKLPNILSLVRILLIPVFVMIFLWENGNINYQIAQGAKANGYVIAAVIVVISGITDAADGFIARRFNMITDLGKVLDPFADKLTQAAVVLCLVIRYKHLWQWIAALFILILIKELTLLTAGVVFLRKGQNLDGALWYGKLATIVFYILMIVLIGAPEISDTTAVIMLCVMIGFNALAFTLYMGEYRKLWKQRGNNDDNS